MRSPITMALTHLLLISLFATCSLAVAAFESSSRQERFLEDELQNWALGALKTLGEGNDENNITVPPFSTEDFGEEVGSPSGSSRQRKSGDLRNLVKQIQERDEQISNNNNAPNQVLNSAGALTTIVVRATVFACFSFLLVNMYHYPA